MDNQDEFLKTQEQADNENQIESINTKNLLKKYRRSVRHVCNVIGWSLTFLIIATIVVGVFLEVVVSYLPDENLVGIFLNKMLNASWYENGGSTLVLYAVVLPFMFWILKFVPDGKSSKDKITFRQFVKFFIVAQGFGTIFNIIGTSINEAVAASSGGNTWDMNPVNEMLESISPMIILYTGFLGPIIEEYIFRWKLLNRLRRFGDKAAITYTAVMFGLFHGNLVQFFYATAIGMVLGYVAVKTGRMRYNCLMHILINCWSLLIVIFSTREDTLAFIFLAIIAVVSYIAVIAAIIFTILYIYRRSRRSHRKNNENTDMEVNDSLTDDTILEKARFKDICMSMYVNPGTLAFILVSIVQIAFFLSR